MALPHQFQALLGSERRPSIFAGAGLSFGIIPTAAALYNEKKDAAEASLGVGADIPAGTDALYQWADQMLAALGASGENLPKLALAKSLGLLEDAAWAGDVSYPVSGTAARHRVIARFSREGLWESIWTWNWDCILERGLEAIGFTRGLPSQSQPWLTRYASVVVQGDFPRLGNRHLLCILKPHGCVMSLAEAEAARLQGDQAAAAILANRFMIGATELAQMRKNPTDQLFFGRMSSFLSSNPALIVGWSVAEPYLAAVINEALSLVLKKGQIEELSIVDIAFNSQGHAKVAECYGLTEEQVFFEVAPTSPGFTSDEFFLWLQARLCILRMAEAVGDLALRESILAIDDQLTEDPNALVVHWADVFMSAWCRMCWRGGIVSCAGFQPHQLALDAAEEHIPLTLPGVVRPDLAAAARLFVALQGSDWDLSKFPGALWRQSELRLVIPLPAWGEFNDLSALKPFTSSISLSWPEHIDILPLHFEPDAAIDLELVTGLKIKLAAALSLPAFATSESIGVAIDILENEVPHE